MSIKRKIKTRLPTPDEARRLGAIFQSLGDLTRQKILFLLERGPRSVTQLVKPFSLTQPTVSRHLQVLKHAGLVTSQRRGQKVFYQLNPEVLRFCHDGFFCCFDCCPVVPLARAVRKSR